MNKLLFLSLFAILFGSLADSATQTTSKFSAEAILQSNRPIRPPRAEQAPAAPQVEVEQEVSGPSLDETLKWLQENINSPFNITAKANARFSESVFYSTELVDWKGCTVHFRSERDHSINGDTTKRAVEETIPLGDVDPSRIEPYPLHVPGLIWEVPSISVSTSYRRHTILDTWQSPDQDTFYTNLVFSDPSGEKIDRIVGALQYSVDLCGGQPEIF